MSKVVVRLIWALFLVAAGSGELLAQKKLQYLAALTSTCDSTATSRLRPWSSG